MLSLRGSQCAAHPCSKVVGTQSLGRQACEAKRDSQSQGCRGSKACRHSASDVDRRYRIQLVVKGGCQSTCIAGQPNSRRSAGTNVPAGTLALVRSPLALRCSREQNALHTLIRQRHLTPSCGGQVPTAERTLDPARMLRESLNPGPELENPARFKRSRSVGAYVGLTTRRYASGEVDWTGRISKCGDKLLRSYLYEAANVLLT